MRMAVSWRVTVDKSGEPRRGSTTRRNGFGHETFPFEIRFRRLDMAVRIFALTLVSGLAVIPAFAQEDGQTAFNNSCRTCHTMEEGDHRQGPISQASSAARRGPCQATLIRIR